MSFLNKTVVITGAAGNLGRAVAQAFYDRGALLLLVDLRIDDLRRNLGEESPRRLFIAADLLKAEQAAATVQAAIERTGRIDVLCNLAGGFRMGEAVHETTVSTWNFMFDLNVRTLLNMVQATVPHMVAQGGGKIVNISGFAALKGAAQMGAYIGSKSVVIRLTESMAAELREMNVNVNCVLPTIINTPENRAAMPDADPGRWVEPQDLAAVITFLASDAARAIHGASLPVTGKC